MRLLPGANQEYLGCDSLERPASGDLLPGIWTPDRDRKLPPWGLCDDQGGAGPLDWVEDGRLVGFGGHLGWGGALAPADRIRGPTEVPPVGVGLCEMRHPRHRDGLPGGGRCAVVHLPYGSFSGEHGTDPREGNHWPAGQTGIKF